MVVERSDKIKELFARYDKNGDGSISKDELVNVMKAVTRMKDAEIHKLFEAMDKNRDGSIEYEEFVDWLFGGSAKKDAKARAALAGDGLALAFYNFCPGGTEMDGKSFAKLCKDCKLLDKKFKPTDVDLIFAKGVPKGQRRMAFEHFGAVLRLVAEKKGISQEEVMEAVELSSGPELKGTQAEVVRFHDDKSTFTGSHARDGRHGTAGSAEARAVSAAAAAAATKAAPKAVAKSAAAPQAMSRGRADSLLEAFKSFCAGHPDMDGKGFAKLCKDCNLLDNKFCATDVDLIFVKVVTKGQRRIGYHQFESAAEIIAEKKGIEVGSLHNLIQDCGGPVLCGTQAEAVRFHDDKGTYTGVHGTDGRHKAPAGSSAHRTASGSPQPKATGAQPHQRSATPDMPAAAAAAAPAGASGFVVSRVHEVFLSFCGAAPDLDGKSFAKLCKDCGLLDKKLTPADADLIFAKVVSKGARRISWEQFEGALRLIAEKKGVTPEDIDEAVISCMGPTLLGTRAEAVRFHDDKSTYTGSHLVNAVAKS